MKKKPAPFSKNLAAIPEAIKEALGLPDPKGPSQPSPAVPDYVSPGPAPTLPVDPPGKKALRSQTFDYDLGDKVILADQRTTGTVTALRVDNSGVQYRVSYRTPDLLHRSVYFYPEELKPFSSPLPNTKP